MKKAGQTTGQAPDSSVEVVRFSAPARKPGEKAVLVSERSAVWDQPGKVLVAEADLLGAGDPIWDHHGGTKWTPDLVHCRLLIIGAIITCLPSPMRRQYASLLGDLAQVANDFPVTTPPTAAEITMLDFVLGGILKIEDEEPRAIIEARMFDVSYEKIAKGLSRRGRPHKRLEITQVYLAETRKLAAAWQRLQHPVDRRSFAEWRRLFEGRK